MPSGHLIFAVVTTQSVERDWIYDESFSLVMGSSFIILSMREYMLMAYFLKLKIVRIILHNMYKDITDTATAYNLVITNHLDL